MRLLDRYLLREFIAPLVYCLGGFLIFWLTFLVFQEMDDFQRNQLSSREIALYLFYSLPDQLGRVIPLALLLALLYSLTNHSRHHELTAIRCAGVSLWRLSVPYFLTAAVFAAIMFATLEIWLPDGADKAEQIKNRNNPSVNPQAQGWLPNIIFMSVTAGRTNVVGPFRFHEQSGEMGKPRLLLSTPDGGRIDVAAERGVYSNGFWHFFKVEKNVYRQGDLIPAFRAATNYMAVPELKEPPERIRSEIKINSMSNLKAARGMSLSLQEISDYFRWHPESRNSPQLLTKYHSRLAAPFTCIVVVLIALPFGTATGRRNVFVGVAIAIFICFAYFIVQRLGEALGIGGRISPILAGWLPNILFAVLGILMTFRVR